MATTLSSPTSRASREFTPQAWQARAFWLTLACVFASRLGLLAFAHWLPGDDGLRYLQEAQNLVTYGTFSHLPTPAPAPTLHDLPLFPLLLSVLLRLIPDPTGAMRLMGLLNALFFTASAGALFRLTALLSNNIRTAVIASAVFAACPEALPYSLFSMPESLFLLFFLWAVYLQASYFHTGAPWKFLTGFALLGASVLTKPASLFFAAVVVVWAVCFWPRKQPVGVRTLWIAAGLLVESVVVSPWVVRNEITFGTPTLTTITGTNLFNDNYFIMLTDQHNGDPEAIQRHLLEGAQWNTPVEEARIKGTIAKREIMGHWQDYLKTNLKHHPRLYLGTGALALLRLTGDSSGVAALESWQSRPALSTVRQLPLPALLLQFVSWLYLGVLYAAALIGAILLFRRSSWFALAFTVLPLLYFAALIGPVVYTRYRLPMDPFFAILAATCLQRVKTYVLV